MTISEIQLYQILQRTLGDNETDQLLSFIKASMESGFMDKQNILATKSDLDRETFRLREEMINMKADLLQSVYLVGLSQFLAIVGSVLTIFNLILR